MMWVLIFLLIALTLYLLFSLLGDVAAESTEKRLHRLVKQRKSLEGFISRDLLPEPVSPEPTAKQQSGRARRALVSMVERATTGRNFTNRLEIRLQRADWKWKPAEFMVAQGLTGGIGMGIGLVTASSLWWLFLLLGWVAPHLLLGRAEKKRLKAFEQQLPDALSMVANALRSGYSFLQALDVVSREMPDPISKEFGLVLRESRVNIPLDEAMNHLTQRIKSADLDLVVTAVLIQRQVGGNLSEVLEKISGTIKERIRIQGEVRTLTTQGRFSGWIVSLLPVGLVVMMQMIAPTFLNPLIHHPLGWVLIFVAVVMQGMGILIIKNMVSLEV